MILNNKPRTNRRAKHSIVVGSSAGTHNGLYMARAVGYRACESMTQSLHTSFFDQTSLTRPSVSPSYPFYMTPLWIFLMSRRSLYPQCNMAPDSSTPVFFSSLDHIVSVLKSTSPTNYGRRRKSRLIRVTFTYRSAKVCRL